MNKRNNTGPSSTLATDSNELEKSLWAAADQLRANSKLKSSEYSMPVLGLIFYGTPISSSRKLNRN